MSLGGTVKTIIVLWGQPVLPEDTCETTFVVLIASLRRKHISKRI
jgi:hypothetical protein